MPGDPPTPFREKIRPYRRGPKLQLSCRLLRAEKTVVAEPAEPVPATDLGEGC